MIAMTIDEIIEVLMAIRSGKEVQLKVVSKPVEGTTRWVSVTSAGRQAMLDILANIGSGMAKYRPKPPPRKFSLCLGCSTFSEYDVAVCACGSRDQVMVKEIETWE